jgi:multiple sugar transport system permease protein
MGIRVLNKVEQAENIFKVKEKPLGLQGWLKRIGKYAVLAIVSFSYLLPLYWMFSSSLKNDAQVYIIPPVWFPNPALWENFIIGWTRLPFTLYFYNTVFKYAIPVVIGTVLSSAIVAYGFSRINFKGRDLLFGICLMTMMIPFQVTMVPLFIIFKQLGWINTFMPLVVPAFFGSPYFIFMLRQFFRTIPDDLSAAARIDGANEFDILFRIIMPLSRPALMVVALFAFMGAWNDFLGPLIYVNDVSQSTLAIGIRSLQSTLGARGIGKSNAYPYLMAVSTLVTLPILVAFFFAQRTFIEGITLTGMKG